MIDRPHAVESDTGQGAGEQARAKLAEAAIDPDLPIIDAHHHLWDLPGRRYLLAEFLRDITCGHNILATLVVEVTTTYRAEGPEELRCVGETEFLNGIAAMSADGRYGPTRICAGIIGYADFRLGDRVRPVLEAQIAAGNGRLRGIRNTVSWNEHDVFRNSRGTNARRTLLDPVFRKGLACLAEAGLPFDVNLYFTQLGDVADLAAALPALTIVVDHTGGPLSTGPYAARREEAFIEWKQRMQELARLPNIFVKIGGLKLERIGFGANLPPLRPPSQDLAMLWRPYIETCVEFFGPERCMFESNFPPDKASSDYVTLWNGFKRVACQYGEAEIAALFKETAASVYRLQGV